VNSSSYDYLFPDQHVSIRIIESLTESLNAPIAAIVGREGNQLRSAALQVGDGGLHVLPAD